MCWVAFHLWINLYMFTANWNNLVSAKWNNLLPLYKCCKTQAEHQISISRNGLVMYLTFICFKIITHSLLYFTCAFHLCHWSPCAHEPLEMPIRYKNGNTRTEIKCWKEFCYEFQGRAVPFREILEHLCLCKPLSSFFWEPKFSFSPCPMPPKKLICLPNSSCWACAQTFGA